MASINPKYIRFAGSAYVGRPYKGFCVAPVGTCEYPALRVNIAGEIYALVTVPETVAGDSFPAGCKFKTASTVKILNPVVVGEPYSYQHLPGFLTVRFANLGGDFAPFNGDHVLRYSPTSSVWPNRYFRQAGDYKCFLWWYLGSWRVELSPQVIGTCTKKWIGGVDFETPTGTYAAGWCGSTGCVDTNSCSASAGGICRVRVAGTIA